MPPSSLTQIWSRADYDAAARDFTLHADDAIALTKPPREPAQVVDIRSGEQLR